MSVYTLGSIHAEIAQAFENPTIYPLLSERLALHDRVTLPADKMLEVLPERAKDVLNHNPDEWFKIANEVLHEAFQHCMHPGLISNGKIPIRLKNYPDAQPLSDMRVEDRDKLSGFTAQLLGISNIIPSPSRYKVECPSCAKTLEGPINGPIFENVRCTCGRSKVYIDPSKHITYENSVHLALQNPLDSIDTASGGMVSNYTGILKGDMCKNNILQSLEIGAPVEMTSIVRISSHKGQNSLYFDINYIDNKNKIREELALTPEDKERITKITNHYDFIENIAGDIYDDFITGNDLAKQAIILTCIGGTSLAGTVRGQMFTLLLGDPSSGKSALLQLTKLMRLHAKTQFVDGSIVSKAGLVSATVFDEILRSWIVYPGALPLANDGLCLLDELDKIEPEEIVSINNAIEAGEVYNTKVQKARFAARTAIVAAANPKGGGNFDPFKDPIDQLTLPTSTMTRCDFICLFKSPQDEDTLRKIMDRMLDKRKLTQQVETFEHLYGKKWSFYRRWFHAARKIHPAVHADLKTKFADAFIRLKKGENPDKSHKVVSRHGETMLRVSQARARLRLSDHVNTDDVEFAEQILSKNLTELGHALGPGGLDNLYTGRTESTRNKIRSMMELMEKLCKTEPIKEAELLVVIEEQLGLSAVKAREVLQKMEHDGMIMHPRPDEVKLV